MARQQIETVTHHFTTEAPGWRPYFKENEGYKGLPLHDVLDKAGLGFQTIKVPTAYLSPVSGKSYPSNAYSVIRVDTDEELGYGFTGGIESDGRISNDGYKVIQHEEALQAIFHDVLNLETSAHCVNAIGLNNGARVGISFRLPDNYMIRPEDFVGLYLNFWNSFNGKGGVGASWFELRPVCINTFHLAFSNGKNKFMTRHTKNADDRIRINAAEVLGLARKEFEENAKLMQLFAQTPADSELVKKFLLHMNPDKPAVDGKVNQGPANRREELLQVITNGENTDPKALTIYDLFAGVTKMTSWKRTNSRKNDEEQFVYAMTGTGAVDNSQAYDFFRKELGK